MAGARLMVDQIPIGRVVHYVSHGSPNGEYTSQCRAAIVTEVDGPQPASAQILVGLCILNPTGLFFNRCPQSEDDHRGGTWHWPERT